MGYRLSKIYTRTGDAGSTGLSDGSRVPKHGLRMEAIGTVDELNSHIGLLAATPGTAAQQPLLRQVQKDLFDLGGELSMPGHGLMQAVHDARLEQALDALNDTLPPLTNFILPGGSVAASQAHLARAVCRRAERTACALHAEAGDLNPHSLAYLNRLSDLLFVLARVLARQDGGAEILWQQPARP